MATREEILEEIRKLDVAIAGLQSDLRSPTIDATTRNTTMNLIASTIGLLTVEKQRLLFFDQQGKFLHIFPLFVPNLLDVIHCPTSFDISTSPIQVRRLLKVRGDGNRFDFEFHALTEYSFVLPIFGSYRWSGNLFDRFALMKLFFS